MGAAWIFIAFIVLMLARVPVAIALFASSAGYAAWSGLVPIRTLVSMGLSGTGGFLLVAIPTFILMAEIMNRSTITGRIVEFALSLVGHLRGSLAQVCIISSLIFAGMSGSAIADIAGLGRIQVRAMREAGFAVPFAAAITAVASTLAPILPPSIIMVVYASAAEVSVGRIFLSGVTPAFLMAAGFMLTVYMIALRHPEWKRFPKVSWRARGRSFGMALPALLTPLILLGGFLSGYWTPTEAGAVASLWALIVARFVYRDIAWGDLVEIFAHTAISTGNILLIFASSHIVSQLVALEDLPGTLTDQIAAMTRDPLVVLALINIAMFIGGMLLEPTPLLLIGTPFLLQLCHSYGFDPVHIGLVCVLNLMLGTITPPFAIALFAIADVVRVPFHVLVRATLPFYLPFFGLILLVTYFPSIAMWLPRLAFGS